MTPSEVDSQVRLLMSRAGNSYRSADAARKDVVNALTHYKGLTPRGLPEGAFRGSFA